MMKTMIDTNILYCLSGVTNIQPSSLAILKSEMAKMKPICISELSLLELLTHRQFGEKEIKQVLDYITKNHIYFVNFLPLDSSLLKDVFIDFKDKAKLETLRKKALTKKVKIESDTLPLVVVGSVTVLALFYDNKTQGYNAKIKLTQHLLALIESNIEFVKTLCKETVEKYYRNYNTGEFKDDIKGYILTLLYVLTINYALSENGLLLSDLDIDEQDIIDTSILTTHNGSDFRDHILSKLKGKRPNGLLAKKEFWNDLDSSLKIFFDSLQAEFNPGIINYYSIFIREMFTADTKFEKNNLIDSHFHEYTDKYFFYTLDETLTASFEKINPDFHKKLVELQQRIKYSSNNQFNLTTGASPVAG